MLNTVSKKNKFVVITPTYNTAPYIEQCINSVLDQDYDNIDYLVVDDCSTDGTTDIVRRVHEERGGFRVQYNPKRTESPLGNFVLGIQLSPGDREDIFVTVDGDDWLSCNDAISYLNEVYQNDRVWMTYGQFVSASGKIKDYCKPIGDIAKYRTGRFWVTSHVRTIKRKLWDRVNDADLRDKDGKYYVYCPETAYMYPAIEMAGFKHIKFIDKVLYVYNDLNPLCSVDDWLNKDKMKIVGAVSREIKSKKQYRMLREL